MSAVALATRMDVASTPRKRRRLILWLVPCLLGVFVLIALAAPAFTSVDPNAVDLRRALSAPGRDGLFGTDQLGRDVYARVAWAAARLC